MPCRYNKSGQKYDDAYFQAHVSQTRECTEFFTFHTLLPCEVEKTAKHHLGPYCLTQGRDAAQLNPTYIDAQQQFLTTNLAASTADYNYVIGHYPLFGRPALPPSGRSKSFVARIPPACGCCLCWDLEVMRVYDPLPQAPTHSMVMTLAHTPATTTAGPWCASLRTVLILPCTPALRQAPSPSAHSPPCCRAAAGGHLPVQRHGIHERWGLLELRFFF